MTKEDILNVWLNSSPTVNSPYKLYGCPLMWETLREDNYILFTRPGRTHDRSAPFMPYQEVDGVHWQWQKDGKWVGQGYQGTFEYVQEKGFSK